MVQPVPASRPVLEIAQKSDPGRDPNKQVNEDACAYRETRIGHLLVVCDGMGGHAAGREAANLAVQTIVTMVEGAPDGLAPAQVLKGAIEQAGRVVFQMGGSGAYAGRPGSTVVAILIHAGGTDVAHVGDSRAYCIRSGQIYPLTRDHSMVQQMIDAGMLHPEQAYGHPDSNKITRALGLRADTEVDVRPEPMPQYAGDLFLLASDGLLDVARPEEILGVVMGAAGVDDACGKLVELANARGGPDNITVQLARVIEPGGRTAALAPPPPHTQPPMTVGAAAPAPGGGTSAPHPTMVEAAPQATLTDAPAAVAPGAGFGSSGPSPTTVDEPSLDDFVKPSGRGGLYLGLGIAAVGLIIVAVSFWWLLGRDESASTAPSPTSVATATATPTGVRVVPPPATNVPAATATARATAGGHAAPGTTTTVVPVLTALPSGVPPMPTTLPTAAPSGLPTAVPTAMPTGLPTTVPTAIPVPKLPR